MILIQADAQSWNCYRHALEWMNAYSFEEVIPLLQELEKRVEQQHLYAAGYLHYEAARAFDPALRTHASEKGQPLVRFALFDRFEQGPLDAFIPDVDSPAAFSSTPNAWTPVIVQASYNLAIEQIHRYLEQGDSYQVNYTMPLKGEGLFPGDENSLLAFFRTLQQGQQGQYGAYINTGKEQILSLSPELFFQQEGEQLRCRPMKGTAPRGRWEKEDLRQKEALYHSEKNRAENLMILDMIRNDLGRIAQTGSVEVEELFALESYPSLHQMVSQVSCRSEASLADIFTALFPCASITGAPKVRTMEIIKELEPHWRGIYTGSIGYLHPRRKRRFNVAIRTLVNRPEESSYSVGGGIVWDSDKEDEYAEALLKSRVIQQPLPDFELLETMLWRAEKGFLLLEEHLDRLHYSAAFFGFPLDRAALKKRLLQDLENQRPEEGDLRVRLTLNRKGQAQWTRQPCTPTVGGSFTLSSDPVDSKDLFLFHKTTHRQVYQDRALKGVDFTLLQNERGELTEFTIGNLVICKNGRCLTPPLSSGLLPGVYRGHLLEQGDVEEAVLYEKDLLEAEEVWLVNGVRGKVKVLALL